MNRRCQRRDLSAAPIIAKVSVHVEDSHKSRRPWRALSRLDASLSFSLSRLDNYWHFMGVVNTLRVASDVSPSECYLWRCSHCFMNHQTLSSLKEHPNETDSNIFQVIYIFSRRGINLCLSYWTTEDSLIVKKRLQSPLWFYCLYILYLFAGTLRSHHIS